MTIETKDTFGNLHTYRVVDKMPSGYVVWNIGENMGHDEYIPICTLRSTEDCPYAINPYTVAAIKLPADEVSLLRRAAHHGITSLREAERTIRSRQTGRRTTEKREIAEKVRPIFERITE